MTPDAFSASSKARRLARDAGDDGEKVLSAPSR
jgi:hypothetical protein